MKRILIGTLAAALAVTCAACKPVAPAVANTPDFVEPETYSLQGGQVIDRDGNPVDESQNFDVIYAIDSERPQAKTLSRMEDTGERDEYGNPRVRHLTALYDLEGILLCDWDEVSYESGFDDYIVRREARQMDMIEEIKPGFSRGLWSLTEKKLVLPEAVSVEVYDEQSYLVSDNMNRLLGRVDRKLNPLGEFPVKENFYSASVWGGYIAVTTQDPYRWYREENENSSEKPTKNQKDFLLTKDYQVVLEKKRVHATFYQAYSEKLVMCEEKGVQQLYSMSEKKVVKEWEKGMWLNYFDDEVIMLRKDKIVPSDQNDRFISWLETVDGERLTEDYRMMEPVQAEGLSMRNTPAIGFIGVRDGRIELLDRKGKVTKQVEMPNVILVSPYGETGYIYGVELKDESGKTITDQWGTAITREGLLDKDLRVVIPAEKYQFLNPQHIWNGNKMKITNLLSGYYTMPGNRVSRCDLVDTSGKVIAAQLTMVGQIGEDRVQVTKGFEQGLMNFKGEWIYKQSLFHALEDE